MTYLKHPCILRFHDWPDYINHAYGFLHAHEWDNKVFYSAQPEILENQEFNAIIRRGDKVFLVASIDLLFVDQFHFVG